MIELAQHAARMWPVWFANDPAPLTEPVLLAGGPAHEQRAMVFLVPRGDRRPAVVLKVALTPEDARSLEREHRTLSEVRSIVPSRMRESIPEALGLHHVGEATVLATRAQEGCRLMVPPLAGKRSYVGARLVRSFLARAFAWTSDLARVTQAEGIASGAELKEIAERFLLAYPCGERAEAQIRAFARSLDRAGIAWTPSWQHREVSEGNVLIHRGRLRFVDWEHASGASEPWFDIAYGPGALTLLVRRQGHAPSVRAATLRALGPGAWAGRILRAEMERAWRHPLPLAWAVALVAMGTALRRGTDGRRWSDWGEFALCLLAERDTRRALGSLAPEW